MCLLGKGSANCQLQTTHPTVLDIQLNTPTHYVLYCSIASSSRALADILEIRGLGRWICMVLEWIRPLKRLANSRIVSLLQRQSTSLGRLRNHQTFSSTTLLGTFIGPGKCMRLVLVSSTLIYSCIIPPYETLHDRPLRASEPPDIFLLGTRAPRDRILHGV